MLESTFLSGALVAIAAALIGIGIRRKTMFLYPTDFISITMFFMIFMQYSGIAKINEFTGWNMPHLDIGSEWYLTFVLAYAVGYCIDGFLAYTMIRILYPKIKHSRGEHWVIYKQDGKFYLAEQNNRGLARRLIWRIHHEIRTNSPLEADWTDSMKYPLFFEFFREIIYLETVDMKEIPQPGKRWYQPRRYYTEVFVARGSMISQVRLIYESDAVMQANKATAEANERIAQLKHYISIKIPQWIARFLEQTYGKAPGLSFIETIDATQEKYKAAAEEEAKAESEDDDVTEA